MSVFAEIQHGNTVFGVTGQFKVNRTAIAVRRDHRTKVIHLASAKPQISIVTALFTTVISGAYYPASGFSFVNRHEIFELTNLTHVTSPMTLHPDDTPIIPITFVSFGNEAIISDFHSDQI